jgi:RNA polymerase sigma-70 factor (ECF subfamily)
LGNKTENQPDQQNRLGDDVVTDLFHAYQRDLFYFLLGILRDEAVAMDVLQTTFVKLIEQGGGVAKGSLKSWLFRVAHNEAIERRRRVALELRHQERLAGWQVANHNSIRGVDEFWEGLEQQAAVKQAIETLSPDQRTVVIKRIYEGQKFAAISQELGVPLGTVLTRMRAALAKLRRVFAGDEVFASDEVFGEPGTGKSLSRDLPQQ